ncbi:MAG: T9SS type A sorting domain-containing protein, partial [Armatimonadetes bacterium]|nr:T9SS type A sorting domain-containing protein [Armatimonadota bacterium]
YYLGENIWLMGAKFAIYRSVDNAVSWSEVGFPRSNAESFSFFNGSFGMSVPGYRMFQGNERIQRTYDSGKTWEIADYGIPLHHEMGAISVVSPRVAYCAGVTCRDGYVKGCKGIIYKTIDGGGPANNPTGVVEFAEWGSNFTVFPNPTTSTLQLTYQLSSQEQRLVVSDLLGSVVRSTTALPGSTHTTLNLRDLPAGTYFCRLGEDVRTFVLVR